LWGSCVPIPERDFACAAGHGERTRRRVDPGSQQAILITRRALRQRGSKDRIRRWRPVISGAGNAACSQRSEAVA
jgi:hypothetical protein